MPRRPRRAFTAEFEAKVVLGPLAGNATQAEACRERQLGPTLLALWKATLLERLPTVSRADGHRAAGAGRTAELERPVGQQALALPAPKKASARAGGVPPADGRSRPRWRASTRPAGCAARSAAPARPRTARRKGPAWGERNSERRRGDWPGRGPPTGAGGSPRCPAAIGGRWTASGRGG